jgi:hypothetical protein
MYGLSCFYIEIIRDSKPRFIVKLYSRFNEMNVCLYVDTFSRSLMAHQWMATVGLGGGALADILIAGSMCWYLYHKRKAYAK